MYAAIGDYVITPMSTLVYELTSGGSLSVSDAEDRVMDAFGLPSVPFATYLPLARLERDDATSGAYWVANIELYSTVVQITNLFAGASSSLPVSYFADFAFAEIASRIASADSVVDLITPDVISDVINGVSTSTGTYFTQTVVDGTAAIIATGNQALAALPAAVKEDATNIVKVKKVMQGDAAQTLFGVGTAAASGEVSGDTAIADAVLQFTGANLTNRIQQATVGNVFPSKVLVSDAIVREGDSGQRQLEFKVFVVGDHTDTISVSYTTAVGLAIGETDYAGASGLLTWLPGDTSQRSIFVTVYGDTEFEQDELLQLVLSNGTNASLQRSVGYGFIINDDAHTYTTSISTANDVVVRQSSDRANILLNGADVENGSYFDPLSLTIQGQDNIDDTLTLDFTANTYRGDNYRFFGGNGQANDSVKIVGGSFDRIIQRLTNTSDGSTTFTPIGATASTSLSWFGLEPFSVNSTVQDFVFELPGNSDAIIEDADPTDLINPGMMLLRSATGAFETTTFSVPGNSLTIRGGNGAAKITIKSLDPAFGGTLIVDGHALGLQLTQVTATNLAMPGGLTINDAQLQPHGRVTLNGSLVLNAGADVLFNVRGVTPGVDHDQLVSNGIALGDASLHTALSPGLIPGTTTEVDPGFRTSGLDR